ncbi:MAG: acetate kinase [Deltaproteobacteria bacterium]|nr:acetate kinase [Deltaproteobacteria bacterium]
MNDAIIVINAGSSSLKFGIYAALPGDRRSDAPSPDHAPWLRGQIEGLDSSARFLCTDSAGVEEMITLTSPGADHAVALDFILDQIALRLPNLRIVGAGHRVVHGGARFCEPVVVDRGVLDALHELVPLAPRHQPHGIAAIDALCRSRPDLIQVACFDTAFHTTQHPLAKRFPLPPALYEAGVRRYGFHGLSYESVASRLPEWLGETADRRVVVGHLGAGASLAALRKRRCVATTMGLTPLDGLMMGTRPGSLDPGVLLHLMREHDYDESRLSQLLHDQSGLLGVSQLSSDMRTLLSSDAPEAKLAVDLFVYRLVQEVASMVSTLDGIDALVFTGGVGENAASIRGRVCRRLAWLGIDLDVDANGDHGPRITTPDSRVPAWVVPTNEEAVIATHTRRHLAAGSTPSAPR